VKDLEEEAATKLLWEQQVESVQKIAGDKQGGSLARKKKIWASPRRHLEVGKVCFGWQALVYFNPNGCWSLLKASDSCWCVN